MKAEPWAPLRELAIQSQPGGIAPVVEGLTVPQPDGPIPDLVLPSQPAPKYHGDVKAMVEDLHQRRSRREAITFVIPSDGKAGRLREILKEYEVPFESAEDATKAEHQSDGYRPCGCFSRARVSALARCPRSR